MTKAKTKKPKRIKVTRELLKEKLFVPMIGITVENILDLLLAKYSEESSRATTAQTVFAVLNAFNSDAVKKAEAQAFGYSVWYLTGFCSGMRGAGYNHE